MEELIRELIHIGLSEKEAAVYLASLELGPAVVQDVAKKANVNRATTYVCIESLAARGLMSTYVKGKKRFFTAESPDRLLSIVRLQRRELEEKEREVESTIPKLLALFNVEGEKPHVRYMEGPQGIKTILEIFESLEGDIIQIVPVEEVERIHELISERENHLDKLKKQGTVCRALAVMKEMNFDRFPDLPKSEIRAIPQDKFPIHGEISVRGNTVFMYSYKSTLLGLVITCKELADTLRALFQLAWDGSEQYPLKKSE
ncbi:hypothetical protein CO172_03140 [Candidatus Uhrbacteria bacterium CG_4_9_14_3_um_filter_36_7]|uniref:Transcription regulator TrmB N-terminal domain-containing protein n=1 Tax=Candidatus Uhrbacteria bacterium CG_4_9_14_3_um_filter_36_7 TaxID=1975033 RepID=A0A2M7XH37_9BACT|nr:MAG: hypothetical protein CO172_03140 [Candidatus Uhrbacteria bacterium CG_4_9_14_3_um_filter_36_7]